MLEVSSKKHFQVTVTRVKLAAPIDVRFVCFRNPCHWRSLLSITRVVKPSLSIDYSSHGSQLPVMLGGATPEQRMQFVATTRDRKVQSNLDSTWRARSYKLWPPADIWASRLPTFRTETMLFSLSCSQFMPLCKVLCLLTWNVWQQRTACETTPSLT